MGSTHQPLGFKMPTEISTYIKDPNYKSDSYNASIFIVTSVQYSETSPIGQIWNFAIPISAACFVIITLCLMCFASKIYCRRRRPGDEDNIPVTTKYRVAMSNKLMLDLENGLLDEKDMPCLHCKFIEMGEMACYTSTCPECGRPPPIDMGSPSPRLLPKCKSQCYGGDRVEAEKDEAYFQFPPINLEKINLEKDLENMCNTSDTTFASGSTSK